MTSLGVCRNSSSVSESSELSQSLGRSFLSSFLLPKARLKPELAGPFLISEYGLKGLAHRVGVTSHFLTGNLVSSFSSLFSQADSASIFNAFAAWRTRNKTS